MSASDKEFLTKTEFATFLGVAKSYVSKLGNQGRLVLRPDGLVDVKETLAILRSTTGAPERAVVAATTQVFTDHKERREMALAEMAEMDVAERRGTLMRSDDVRSTVVTAATGLRSRLEAWPDLLAPTLAAISDEGQIRATLAGEVESMLTELSHQFSKLTQEQYGRT